MQPAPEAWQQVKRLFGEALELPAAERAAFLDAACGGDPGLRDEVGRLIDLEGGDESFLAPPPGPSEPDAAADHVSPLVGRTVGRYRILRRIAAGSMGTVFEAEQENPRRRVALKILRHGLTEGSTVRRFRDEVHTLGTLHHPGIAQIYEAGTFDLGDGSGHPYFAMELVDGLPLLDYARDHGLDHGERLRLMIRICEAVHHAHRKGVIHRDLKPANILVNREGEPKVLDFGVARSTDADIHVTTVRTRIGELIGTVAYMSPEQLAGDADALDTRSDVYALGVICFEMLAGRLPYELRTHTLPELLRAIEEQDPLVLGVVDRSCRGDLTTIVGKALEKDRERRYRSASDLADDIRRHLGEEPIEARAPTRGSRLRKLLRRHRTLVNASVALVLVLASGLLLGYARRAREEARVAAAGEAQARAVSEFLAGVIAGMDAEGDPESGRDRILDRLDRAAAGIDAAYSGDALAHAAVHAEVGRIFLARGFFEKAERHLGAAIELAGGEGGARRAGEDGDLVRARLGTDLARALLGQGRLAEAEERLRAAVETLGALQGRDHHETLAAGAVLEELRGRMVATPGSPAEPRDERGSAP